MTFDMRGWIVIAVLALAVTGCGANPGDGNDEPGSIAVAASEVELCAERLLRNADLEALSDAEKDAARRYAEMTYCSRFAERGWVYDDGTLSIQAHTWLEEGIAEECTVAEAVPEGQPATPARTVPCEELDAAGSTTIADCALLRHVRASEVHKYLDELQRSHGSVECDDGTPLEELGAP